MLVNYPIFVDDLQACQVARSLGKADVQIHISKTFRSLPGGFMFRKRKERGPVMEKLFQNMAWINSFGLYDFYTRKIAART